VYSKSPEGLLGVEPVLRKNNVTVALLNPSIPDVLADWISTGLDQSVAGIVSVGATSAMFT
jgi:hypothetical protein